MHAFGMHMHGIDEIAIVAKTGQVHHQVCHLLQAPHSSRSSDDQRDACVYLQSICSKLWKPNFVTKLHLQSLQVEAHSLCEVQALQLGFMSLQWWVDACACLQCIHRFLKPSFIFKACIFRPGLFEVQVLQSVFMCLQQWIQRMPGSSALIVVMHKYPVNDIVDGPGDDTLCKQAGDNPRLTQLPQGAA